MEIERGRVSTTRAMKVMSSESSFKRRKLVPNVDEKVVKHRYDVNSPEISVSQATSETSDRVPVSRCSSNNLNQFGKNGMRSVDLKVELQAEHFRTEISEHCRFRETTPSTELCKDTSELKTSKEMKTSAVDLRRKYPVAKIPSAEEIEDFFSAAEKYKQNLFVKKYNYDIVKDVPMEGRYQWVRLKP